MIGRHIENVQPRWRSTALPLRHGIIFAGEKVVPGTGTPYEIEL
jgi:hypothetical protein